MDPKASIAQYLGKIKNLQEKILQYLEKVGDSEDDFQNLNNFIDEQNIKAERYDLKCLLHLLIHIANNHRRNTDFFTKIERIFLLFKDNMIEFYTVEDLFNVFKNNKRMLLFLFKEEIIPPESTMVSVITNEKFKAWFFPNYFLPEFKSIFNNKLSKEISDKNQKMINNTENDSNNADSFNQKRQIGENHSQLCQIIRKDSLDEFTSYVTTSNTELTSTIEPSIFETNSFLLKRKPTLIEYCAFYGSINIFKHLQSNQVELTPSLWMYAIHSQNLDLIKLLQTSQIKPQDETYYQCYLESIKCHHLEIADYISSNCLKKKKGDYSAFVKCLRVYNMKCLPETFENNFNIFYDFCEYDYFYIVSILLDNAKIDLNARRISSLISNKISNI